MQLVPQGPCFPQTDWASLLLRGGRAWSGSRGPTRRTPRACSQTCGQRSQRARPQEAAQASGSQVLLQERTARAGQVRGRCFKPEVRPCPPHGKRTLSKAAPSGARGQADPRPGWS